MFDNLKDKEDKQEAVTPAVNQPSSPFSPVAAPIGAQTANPKVKSSSGLEDIFSGSETAVKPPVFQPKVTMAADPYPGYNDIKEPKGLINKLFFLLRSSLINPG